MSAETLRKAATLMRERAEAASTLRWVAGLVEGYPAQIEDDHSVLFVAEESFGTHEDAIYIASWSPAVALAVADWLDAEAAALDSMAVFSHVAASIEHEVDIRGAALTLRKDDRGAISLTADTSRPALAVASAYLGLQKG